MLAEILDLIWPRICAVCEHPVDRPGRHLCSDCLNRLPFVPTTGCCRRCGRDAIGLSGDFLCEDCRVYKPAFDRTASALRFDGGARALLHGFKFRHHVWLQRDLVDFLEATARARFLVSEIDVVLSVPATLRHFWYRGYAPSRMLARPLARRLGKPFPPFVMRRAHLPRRQAGLRESERRTNVIGTFAVMRPSLVRGKTVLVVDDVMTTGSTLSACAAELKRAGAARVWCLSLARSLHT